MNDGQTSHITVTYKGNGAKVTRIYAVNENIARELERTRDWLGRKPTGQKLQLWLEDKGCQLDCEDGPAFVYHYPNGTTEEEYYRKGKRHREDGPAYIRRSADGTVVNEYYLDDMLLVQRPSPKAPEKSPQKPPYV